MAKQYNKKKLIADYKTGGYTQRELASTYKLSVAMVAKITKDIEKESEHLVNTKIAVEHALSLKSEQEANSIALVVNRELARKAKAQVFEDYLDDGLGVAAKRGVKILNSADASMDDVLKFGKFQNDARVGLDLQPKFATTNLTNINSQESLSISIRKAEDFIEH